MGLELALTNQEIWTFGLHERAARRTPLVLFANCLNAAAGADYSTFRRINTTAGYLVTTGRTLIITRLLFRAGAASVAWHLAYGTDDVGIDSAVAPAGIVLLDTDAATKPGSLMGLVAQTIYDVPVYYEVPAARYLALGVVDTAVRVIALLFGHEE